MNRKSLYAVRPGKSDKSIQSKDMMNEKYLEKLTKSQLIKMLMETRKPSQPSKSKKINLEYLMDEDPLPGNIEQEDGEVYERSPTKKYRSHKTNKESRQKVS